LAIRGEKMLVKDLKDCKDIVAGDGSIVKEVFRPEKEGLGVGYSMAHARVLPGQITKLHSLNSSEAYFILEGRGRMHIDGEEREVVAGQYVFIPPNAKQKIRNIGKGELVFICIVSPPWKMENEKVLE